MAVVRNTGNATDSHFLKKSKIMGSWKMKPDEIKETNLLIKQAKNNSRTRYETFKKEKEDDIAVLKEMGYTKKAKELQEQLYFTTLHYKYSMC